MRTQNLKKITGGEIISRNLLRNWSSTLIEFLIIVLHNTTADLSSTGIDCSPAKQLGANHQMMKKKLYQRNDLAKTWQLKWKLLKTSFSVQIGFILSIASYFKSMHHLK